RWCVPWSAWILPSASVPVPGGPPPPPALLLLHPFVFSSPWNGFAARLRFGSRAALPRPSLVLFSHQASPLAGVLITGEPGEIRIFPRAGDRNRLFLPIVREHAGLLQPVVLFAHHLPLSVL